MQKLWKNVTQQGPEDHRCEASTLASALPLPFSGELATGVPPTSVSAHGAPVPRCLCSTTGGCSPPDVSAPGRPTPQDPEAPTDLGPTATLEQAKASQFFRSRAKTESSSTARGQPNLGPSLCLSCAPVLITQTPGSGRPGLAPTLTTCAFLGPLQRPRGQPQPYSCQPCRPLRAGGSRNASEEGTFQTDARRITVLSPAPCGTSCCSSQLRLTWRVWVQVRTWNAVSLWLEALCARHSGPRRTIRGP